MQNQQLRRAYGQASQVSEQLRIDNDSLMLENAGLRDKLSFIEGMAGMPETTVREGGGVRMSTTSVPGASSSLEPPGSSNGVTTSNVFTPSAAALIELQELRRENKLLRDKLKMTVDGRPDFDLLNSGASPTKYRGKTPLQPSKAPLHWGSKGAPPPPTSTVNPFTPVALRNMSTVVNPAGSRDGVGMSVSSLRDMLASPSPQTPGGASELETSNSVSDAGRSGSLSTMTLPWSASGLPSQDDPGAMLKLTALMSQRNALARARLIGPPNESTNDSPRVVALP